MHASFKVHILLDLYSKYCKEKKKGRVLLDSAAGGTAPVLYRSVKYIRGVLSKIQVVVQFRFHFGSRTEVDKACPLPHDTIQSCHGTPMYSKQAVRTSRRILPSDMVYRKRATSYSIFWLHHPLCIESRKHLCDALIS